MRISDWSSDVCSSDLKGGACGEGAENFQAPGLRPVVGRGRHAGGAAEVDADHDRPLARGQRRGLAGQPLIHSQQEVAGLAGHALIAVVEPEGGQGGAAASDRSPSLRRSEEHTAELQSLMRISSAAFCFKKKTQEQYRKDKRA